MSNQERWAAHEEWAADVRKTMREYGITQQELGEESGYTVSYIWKVVHGQSGNRYITRQKVDIALRKLMANKTTDSMTDHQKLKESLFGAIYKYRISMDSLSLDADQCTFTATAQRYLALCLVIEDVGLEAEYQEWKINHEANIEEKRIGYTK